MTSNYEPPKREGDSSDYSTDVPPREEPRSERNLGRPSKLTKYAVAPVIVGGALATVLCNGTIQASGDGSEKADVTATLCNGTVLASGDGSKEAGFVAPPSNRKLPPPPPRSISSAETLLACCCCPVTPLARTEAKKPPAPPVAITKLKH